MLSYWWVDDNVAFSPIPSKTDLKDLSSVFQAVTVLVEDYELPYSLEEWGRRGVEVLHSPIPDFRAPSFSQLLGILRWIENRVWEGRKVLIHCFGGLGRSGTVAVAWLMYSKGIPLREALRRVRSVKPGAVESGEQMDVLRVLEEFLGVG
ncbi:dual specificity protein phosphatase family protein [Thermococcus sp.]|uniref:protein-tyrosine phosphatase family protein n=1 Tax=Thermococcus sp. TaxID=35749 RepID=UPI0026278AF3|nr:dual specificity protein phosphatase family protein [Thermococcus sp.]